jgi:hypothetical protein
MNDMPGLKSSSKFAIRFGEEMDRLISPASITGWNKGNCKRRLSRPIAHRLRFMYRATPNGPKRWLRHKAPAGFAPPTRLNG